MFSLSTLIYIILILDFSSSQNLDRQTKRWHLFEYGDQTNPLYLGNDASKLLRLCGFQDEVCPLLTNRMDCIQDCRDAVNTTELSNTTRLRALRHLKQKVRGFQNHLRDPIRNTVLWVTWFSICFGGLFLTVVGHFHWKNLPLVGNWLLDSPTDGIKFRHYTWMRWIILGDSNVHWKTFMKSDAFTYAWTPLSMQPWDRPVTPEEVHSSNGTEPSDSAQPEWKIEDIAKSFGVQIGETEELEDGWEHVIRRQSRLTETNISSSRLSSKRSTNSYGKINAKGKKLSKRKLGVRRAGSKFESELPPPPLFEHDRAYSVLEEYWLRIYGNAWARFRYAQDPLFTTIKERPSIRTIIRDDD